MTVASRGDFDVFLSYNSRDHAAVRRVADLLQQQDVRAWFDETNVIAGSRVSQSIDDGLACSAHCAVFLGPHGLGPWQRDEIDRACYLRVERSTRPGSEFRVIPVLLPGAVGVADLPAAVGMARPVTFRTLDDTDAMRMLVDGIRGTAKARVDPPPANETVRYKLVLEGTLTSLDQSHAIIETLRSLVGDATLTLTRIEYGSIVLFVEGSRAGLEELSRLFATGVPVDVSGHRLIGVEAASVGPLAKRRAPAAELEREGASGLAIVREPQPHSLLSRRGAHGAVDPSSAAVGARPPAGGRARVSRHRRSRPGHSHARPASSRQVRATSRRRDAGVPPPIPSEPHS
jgi:hypothetical protein